jgi:hypothetical protein
MVSVEIPSLNVPVVTATSPLEVMEAASALIVPPVWVKSPQLTVAPFSVRVPELTVIAPLKERVPAPVEV